MIDKQKYIQRFKSLYKKKTGSDISDVDALAHFEKLTTLVSAIYKPIPKSYCLSGGISR